MEILVIKGGNKLSGEIKVSGAKNAAMKVILASLLTDEELKIKNVPSISSVIGTVNMLKSFGVKVKYDGPHEFILRSTGINNHIIPLEYGGLYRSATMMIGPLLYRFGKAMVPNPGGCRIGKRPIDRHIEGLKAMGVDIRYEQGYFYATGRLKGSTYRFERNSHTGTEALILAGVCAAGETVVENAAEEPEVDDLINLLNLMGGQIVRKKRRTIVIKGVKKLSGAEFTIMPDRNEVVTFAIAAIASGGDLIVKGAQKQYLQSFLKNLSAVGGGWESLDPNTIRFFYKGKMKATDIITSAHPGFMTDWQAPWALLMTQAQGDSTIHETVYEDRFGYVKQLQKMGARIDFYNPPVKNPQITYNFNWSKNDDCIGHAIKIYGPTKLHNAILEVSDLRAGATLLISALIAKGTSVLEGIEHIDRGYEKIEARLRQIGADIKRVNQSI